MFACLYAPGCSARLMEVIPQSRGPLADARGSEGPETSRDSVLSRDRQGAAGLFGPETEGLLVLLHSERGEILPGGGTSRQS